MEYGKSARERLNGRQSYREGRGPTEETQSCRNNREIERGRHVSNSVEKTDGAEDDERRENGKREGTNGKIVTRELKQRERGTLSVRTSVHGRAHISSA